MKKELDDRPSVEAARYWVEAMDAGIGFVEGAFEHPVEDACEPLLDIPTAAREAGVEVEFSTTPHAGGRPRLHLARAAVVPRLLSAAAELRETGHTLVIEDAFRTYEMQRDLALTGGVTEKVASAVRLAEPDVPFEVMMSRLSVIVQTRPRGAGHMAGAAVDVSVRGPDGVILDRGGPYITVSEVTPMDSPYVSQTALQNRRFVTTAMKRHGFEPFPFEFWHYSCDDIFARRVAGDPTPALYGPVAVGPDGSTTPISEQLEPMHSAAQLQLLVTQALEAAPPSGRAD